MYKHKNILYIFHNWVKISFKVNTSTLSVLQFTKKKTKDIF